MDTALVREVMRHLLEAGRILDVDHDLWPVWRELHDRVLPYAIGPGGELKEWPEPDGERPDHRHFSHLYPLFPGAEITPRRTPELFAAAKAALALRERHRDSFANWSYAWLACLHARLGDGDAALRDLGDVARYAGDTTLTFHPDYGWGGYRLLQIEASLGVTMAITEMLLQSHDGAIDLLPALPTSWPEGRYTGLMARGAFVVDAAWSAGALVSARVTTRVAGPCIVRTRLPAHRLRVTCGATAITVAAVAGDHDAIAFATQALATYRIDVVPGTPA